MRIQIVAFTLLLAPGESFRGPPSTPEARAHESVSLDGGSVVVASASTPQFGHPMLEEFMLDNFTNLNHASFGATPRSVIEAQRRWIDTAEARPDNWFRTDYKDVLNALRTRVAAVIDAHEDDVTFIENASAAMNAVFRS